MARELSGKMGHGRGEGTGGSHQAGAPGCASQRLSSCLYFGGSKGSGPASVPKPPAFCLPSHPCMRTGPTGLPGNVSLSESLGQTKPAGPGQVQKARHT